MTAENSEQFSRSLPLLGEGGMKKLFSASVAVFGLGGVGGFVVEGLARAGIGTLYIVDGDYIQESNINRQLIAVHSSIGQAKTEAWEQRIKDINPLCSVVPIHQFILPSSDGSIDAFPFWNSVDYIVDAIDTVSAKIALAAEAEKRQIPIIAAMGCGNKLDASAFCFADIYKTDTCPLCKVMRRELRTRKVAKLKVLYSTEKPLVSRRPPASVSWVPSVAGLLIAGEVIRDICGSMSHNDF